MSIVITIGREFGSGGRELGRRIADELGIAYYDKEILQAIAEKTSYCLKYVESVSEERPQPLLPIHYGVTFATLPTKSEPLDVFTAQAQILRELALKSSCVIIGRAADDILADLHPFRIYCYSDLATKVKRCRERGDESPEKDLIRNIKRIDKRRRRFYEYTTGIPWGRKDHYDLMINTTNLDIKPLAHALAMMIKEKMNGE